ncbi:MAG: ISNCY family transposase [bacterium]
MKTIIMTDKDTFRFGVINDLNNKKLSMSQAKVMLGLSGRQVKRLRKKVREEGTEGVIHKGRDKIGNRKMPEETRTKMEKLLTGTYSDFGPTFASEKLEDNHGIIISKETVRSIMVQIGLRKVKSRKKNGEYRAWRPRKDHYGEMLQFDGSYHFWFEGRSGEQCLLASIDDATGQITKAIFAKNEGVIEVSKFWKEYTEELGKPVSIYLDKFSTYKVNHVNAVDNHELLTQFQKMTDRVGIELITAHSPQAKGRIERLFETLQDRLVKEMRLLGISTVEEANVYLRDIFLPAFNEKFGVVPTSEGDVHRQLSDTERENLPSLFSIQHTRVVSNDYCIQFENQWFQLEREQPTTVCRRETIVIEKRIDGTIHLKLREKYLDFRILHERPQKLREKITALVPAPLIRVEMQRKVSVNHPWRSPMFRMAKKVKNC